MSDYYDLNQPYTIGRWNALVAAINNLLENPPENTQCEPIHDLLSSVVDPHRWSVKDIQAARDKLIETCSKISFSQPLRLWYSPVIDELVAAMDQAWCDCDCEETRQLIWQTLGAISDRNYTQEWVTLVNLASGRVGSAGQTFRVQDVDHFNGWTRLMLQDTLNDDGEIIADLQLKVQQPVIYVPRWVEPGSPYWHNIVDNHENLSWVGEITNSYYLELVCEDPSE